MVDQDPAVEHADDHIPRAGSVVPRRLGADAARLGVQESVLLGIQRVVRRRERVQPTVRFDGPHLRNRVDGRSAGMESARRRDGIEDQRVTDAPFDRGARLRSDFLGLFR